MLWRCYPEYVRQFYASRPGVSALPFAEQRRLMLADHFGWPGGLSRIMNASGVPTEFFVINAEPMQRQWARENDFTAYTENGWEKQIALEQVKRIRPRILWTSSYFDCFGDLVPDALMHCGYAVVWVACPLPKSVDVSAFRTLITTARGWCDGFAGRFREVIFTHPGFDDEVLSKLGDVPKRHSVVFAGSISPVHVRREVALSHLVRRGIGIDIFGTIEEDSPPGMRELLRLSAWQFVRGRSWTQAVRTVRRAVAPSAHVRRLRVLDRVAKRPVFGLDMYRTLASSRIVFNTHVDVAGNLSGNMRLFEATGVGACVLTEDSLNIAEFFEPGKEVVTYRSPREAVRVINDLLRNERRLDSIAAAGSARTRKDHTLEQMWQDVRSAFEDGGT